MKKLLCPSMMCADFSSLKLQLHELETAGADILHLDIMDGTFVPNFGMGLQDTEYLCRAGKIPCEVHLMIQHPMKYIGRFAGMGAARICIHAEACGPTEDLLREIHRNGCKAGLAVNPETSFAQVKPYLPLCDEVLVTCVHPGFAGQSFLPEVTDKIKRFLAESKEFGYEVVLDGACSPERIARFSALGADGFVLGTSALFGRGRPYAELIKELRG